MRSRQASEAQESVDELREQHQAADGRLRELARRALLTPAEQVEQAELKKRKLWLKDRMQALARRQG